MLNKQKVQEFRGEFLKSVEQLEKDFGVVISLGTISFNADELRAKITARVGDSTQISSRNDFKVGDIVGINHKKVDSKRRFKIDKINSKNIKVSELEGYAMMTVSPSLLF
jgi:hypothetical protein